MTTPTSAEAFQAARFQKDLAKNWEYNEQYESSLRFREANPEGWSKLDANHRTAVLGFYLPARNAAAAAGIDVTIDPRGGAR